VFVLCLACASVALANIQGARESCKEMEKKCAERAAQESTVNKCLSPLCFEKDGEGYCNDTVIDCMKSDAAEDARKRNQRDPNSCFTVACNMGSCEVIQLKGGVQTKCVKSVCVESADGWNWEEKPTEEAQSCVSDECFYRECLDEKGCVPTDICSNRTNQCTSYGCNKNNQCVGVNNTLVDTECYYQVCKDGKIETVWRNITEACPKQNKCQEATCNRQGQCVYNEVPPPPEEVCFNYTCDPEKGWIETPKCDDGLYCTIDRCSVSGECRFQPRDCSSEIPISECYIAMCNEEKKRCGKRLNIICQDPKATLMCFGGECMDEKTITARRWAVAFDLNQTVDPRYVDTIEVADYLSTLLGTEIDESNSAIEVNPEGVCPSVLLLTTKETAYAISEAVDKMDKGAKCDAGILCYVHKTRVIGEKDESSESSKYNSDADRSDRSKVTSADFAERDAKACIFAMLAAVLVAMMNLF